MKLQNVRSCLTLPTDYTSRDIEQHDGYLVLLGQFPSSIHQSHPTVGRKSLSGLNGRPVALQPSATYKTEPMETRICCRWLFLFQTGGVGGGVSLANVSRRASANSGVCFTYPGHRLAAQNVRTKSRTHSYRRS